MSARPLPTTANPALLQHAQERRKSMENRVAGQITRFAGSMRFVYIHIIWFAAWTGFPVEPYPFGLLTEVDLASEGGGARMDIADLFARWSAKVKSSGDLLTGASDLELVCDQAGVSGVRFWHAGENKVAFGRAVVLATGGFQGDSELKQRFIGGGADDIAVRSNPRSVGDGFRLGSAAGAAASRHLSGFYGHTLPSPVPVTPEVFLRLTLYFSAYGVIVNRLGRRFTDESLGDEVSDQFVLHQPGKRAVLIWDEVHQQRALAMPYPSGMALDRHAEATKLSARAAQTDTLDELVQVVADWGVDKTALQLTLADYQRASAGEAVALDAPLPERPSPLRTGPFRALEIQPCITIPSAGSG
jgi:FAD binding domain